MHFAEYSYSNTLQPIYIEPTNDYINGRLEATLRSTLTEYGLQLTDDAKKAHTCIKVENTGIKLTKSIKNNLANNDSIFYKSTLSTDLTITTVLQQHTTRINTNIAVQTPVILLENQNLFSDELNANNTYPELTNTLIQRILYTLREVSLRTSSKKAI